MIQWLAWRRKRAAASANRAHNSELFHQHHLVGDEPVVDDLIVFNFITYRKWELHVFISRGNAVQLSFMTPFQSRFYYHTITLSRNFIGKNFISRKNGI